MSQSLARALQILNSLGEGDRSLDQLATELDVHKTTVLRLLRTMEAERFVRRMSPTATGWARGCSLWPMRLASSTSYGLLLRRTCVS